MEEERCCSVGVADATLTVVDSDEVMRVGEKSEVKKILLYNCFLDAGELPNFLELHTLLKCIKSKRA